MDTEAVHREITEDNLLLFTPYKNCITVTLKYGTVLVQAKHDGADELGDMNALITLCIMRYNKGETNV